MVVPEAETRTVAATILEVGEVSLRGRAPLEGNRFNTVFGSLSGGNGGDYNDRRGGGGGGGYNR